MARLELLASDAPIPKSALGKVFSGFCDPMRIFIKNELHPKSKIISERYRLIFSVSLIDQIVDTVLFNHQNNTDVENWDVIPSKIGMGFTDDQVVELHRYVDEHIQNPRGNDASGWDWSVQDWELELECKFRIVLTSSEGTLFAKMVTRRFECLAHSVIVEPDGQMYSQDLPGLMKTGLKITGSSNSRIRGAAHIMACEAQQVPRKKRGVIVNGDDCVTEDLPQIGPELRKLGHRIEENPLPGGFDFCSSLWYNGKRHSLRPDKLTCGLLNQGGTSVEKDLHWEEWLINMKGHPDVEYWTNLVSSVGWRE